MTELTVSSHGYARIMEREDVNFCTAENYASRAWRNGKRPEDYNNTVKRKLQSIESRHGDSVMVRVFANGCYIFSKDGVLITEYPLDEFMAVYNRPVRKRVSGAYDDYDYAA